MGWVVLRTGQRLGQSLDLPSLSFQAGGGNRLITRQRWPEGSGLELGRVRQRGQSLDGERGGPLGVRAGWGGCGERSVGVDVERGTVLQPFLQPVLSSCLRDGCPSCGQLSSHPGTLSGCQVGQQVMVPTPRLSEI